MKTKLSALILVIASLLAGCSTRSISNSGYHEDSSYSGELNELQVLGVEPDQDITNQDIEQALANSGKVQVKRGSRVVFIQSGAQFPDDSLMAEAQKYYNVVPLSGVPEDDSPVGHWRGKKEPLPKAPPLAKSLRLAAAHAGAETLVVYWGVLETAREGYATKAVSWVPIVGDFIPDEDQNTRIRLKAAVIDVPTGNWEILTPEVYSDERTTLGINRENSDQKQVNLLKDKAYARLIADMQTRYSM